MNMVKVLKSAGQDFEWYPTTQEIMKDLWREMNLHDYDRYHNPIPFSMLDIGAGDGRVLNSIDNYFRETKLVKYAIEKSKILIEAADKDIFTIGTDFNHQSLIDKKVTVIFSNPPYKEFVEWAIKIITEGNAKSIYLVIPERWQENTGIQEAIKTRHAKYKIIGNYDFMNAERKARAKVQLIWISFDRYEKLDPFNIWFKENFKIKKVEEKKETQKEKIKGRLVSKKDIVKNLSEMYKIALEDLLKSYKALESISPDLLRELGVSHEGICAGLKLKISGLKNIYWKELFDNLDTITDRLTSDSRNKLLETLNKNMTVDFNEANIYAIVIWAIKNANQYFNDQLLKIYWDMTNSDNVIMYKSNSHIVKDNWRYCREEISKYALDYRIITRCYSAFKIDSLGYQQGDKLCDSRVTFLKDLKTIAKNLGFNVIDNHEDGEWFPGKKVNFHLDNGELFMEVKAHKNGNMHYKFNQKFMLKLNVEAGRLNGWVKSPTEAEREMGLKPGTTAGVFKGNFSLIGSDILMIKGECR